LIKESENESDAVSDSEDSVSIKAKSRPSSERIKIV
jgi:hypothetical protein